MVKPKFIPRTYYVLESEYGLDIKRYVRSIHPTKQEAEALRKYLALKNPYDKFEVIEFVERRR